MATNRSIGSTAPGQQSLVNSRRAWWRLLNLCGGYLKYYGSYSTAQISAAFPMTYGASPSSDISEIANAKFYVTFGHNPAVTRGSGHGKSWQMTCTREAEGGRKPKMIVIDPIYSDTAVAHADEWIPIRPGTDAALVEAIAHELIVHDRVDHAFLAQYCVGCDEGTLPASRTQGLGLQRATFSAEGPTASEDARMGLCITGVPVETIVRLAEEIGTTKPSSSHRAGARSGRPTANRRAVPLRCFRSSRATSAFPARAPASRKATRPCPQSICRRHQSRQGDDSVLPLDRCHRARQGDG